jgi:sugar phosphate isomerase/epimerase
VIHSFTQRTQVSKARKEQPGFDDPLVFLDHVHSIGGIGIQAEIGARRQDKCKQLRSMTEAYGMYVEGSLRLPRDPADVERFTAEVASAKQAGATVLRTVMMSGRRYETFTSDAAFRKAADAAYRSLALAEPIVARERMRLAVENHKDWRAAELVAILKRLGSEHAGACVDTGNSIALLEDTMEVVEALAPWAFTSHLKDMGVQECDQGFLLSEVPLGQGILDIPKIVAILRKARPDIRLNLEMITRDPLKVPCLAERYWATFGDLPGRDLARTLAMVRAHPPRRPLPRVAGRSAEANIKAEDENIRECLAYAVGRL